MGTFSIWHWLVVLVVVLILFGGGGKLSRIMGDFGKGLNAFKKNIKEGDGATAATAGEDPKALSGDQAGAVDTTSQKDQAANNQG